MIFLVFKLCRKRNQLFALVLNYKDNSIVHFISSPYTEGGLAPYIKNYYTVLGVYFVYNHWA